MPPKFIFVRHGEATHNVAFHEIGGSVFTDKKYEDAPLTEQGIQQARETGKALASLDIIEIWSSPLTRCIQTGEEIFEETSVMDCYLHDNLLERLGDNHVTNNRSLKRDIHKKYPEWNVDYIPDMPQLWVETESIYACRQRMWMLVAFLADLYKDLSEDKHILIIGHAGSIEALLGKSLKNAEYVILTTKEILEYEKIEVLS